MPKLTPEGLAELRRIAEAATPGPWTADAGYIVVHGSPMDDEHIAAFDPTTVLALLDRIEALQSMLLHLYQDTVVPGTGYCIRCGMIGGHDVWCAMAAVEELLGIEIEGNGEEEGGATDGC